jgi:Spy/CpxP family protein refolding chaperone
MARLSALLSSASILAVLAGCSGAPPTAAPSPAPTVAADNAAAPGANAATPSHGPGRHFFRQVSALDLRTEQRDEVATIQADLEAEMAPRREAVREVLLKMADAVELGQLDPAAAAEQKARLATTLAGAKATFAKAINGVHDTLDLDQRSTLVAHLEQEREGKVNETEHHQHGLAKVALALGLSQDQQAKLSDAFSKGLDEVFPDRKERRERWEAKMKAMKEAFLTDDFDAADFDLAEHAGDMLESSVDIASRGVDVANRVLSDGQRALAAEWIRDKVRDMD